MKLKHRSRASPAVNQSTLATGVTCARHIEDEIDSILKTELAKAAKRNESVRTGVLSLAARRLEYYIRYPRTTLAAATH
jgi:hypothetical protein